MTQDLKRTRIMVRMKPLFYNWWSVYARMIDPDARREAKTSCTMMMDDVCLGYAARSANDSGADGCTQCGGQIA